MAAEITQAEANALLAMEKHAVDEDPQNFPLPGEGIVLQLTSADRREPFLLDISRGRIEVRRGKYQTRARQTVVLARLDFGGRPHRNPDGEEIPCPHLHLYRAGYGHKWAYPVPVEHFPRLHDLPGTLQDFMRYCNITKPPTINPVLFS